MKAAKLAILLLMSLCGASVVVAADSAVQGKVDRKIKEIAEWAASPVVVDAVKAHNAAPDPQAAGMTQDKWATLPLLDPLLRSLMKNPAAEFLKSKKDDSVSEAFLSGADGTKVAFISKPTNWSHKGKPKHDVPMSGKVWQGNIEIDQSSGLEQLQVAVPVFDGAKPVGSLVVGLSVRALSQ